MSQRHLAHGILSLTVILGSPTARIAAPTAAVIQAPGGIAGHVVDSAGQPLPGVSVTTSPEQGGLARQTTSDGNGMYRFAQLLDNTYRVDFELSGFVSTRWNRVRVGADVPATADAVLSLGTVCECIAADRATLSASRAGQVLDEAKRPLPHARVEIANGTRREAAHTDKEGRFLVRTPVDGTWSLTAFASGFDAASQQLSPVTTEPLVFRLRYAGTGPPSYERLSSVCRCPGDLFTHEGR